MLRASSSCEASLQSTTSTPMPIPNMSATPELNLSASLKRRNTKNLSLQLPESFRACQSAPNTPPPLDGSTLLARRGFRSGSVSNDAILSPRVNSSWGTDNGPPSSVFRKFSVDLGSLSKDSSSEDWWSDPSDRPPVLPDPYIDGPVKIMHNLYLGTEINATDRTILDHLGIHYILNVAKEVQNPWSNDQLVTSPISSEPPASALPTSSPPEAIPSPSPPSAEADLVETTKSIKHNPSPPVYTTGNVAGAQKFYAHFRRRSSSAAAGNPPNYVPSLLGGNRSRRNSISLSNGGGSGNNSPSLKPLTLSTSADPPRSPGPKMLTFKEAMQKSFLEPIPPSPKLPPPEFEAFGKESDSFSKPTTGGGNSLLKFEKIIAAQSQYCKTSPPTSNAAINNKPSGPPLSHRRKNSGARRLSVNTPFNVSQLALFGDTGGGGLISEAIPPSSLVKAPVPAPAPIEASVAATPVEIKMAPNWFGTPRARFRYKKFPWGHNQDNLQEYFQSAFEYIDEARDKGVGVLVHCQCGVSRSATMVLAYVMKSFNIPLHEAYAYVKERSSAISPNMSLVYQLVEFEKKLGLRKCSASGGAGAGGAGAGEEGDDDLGDLFKSNPR